MASAGRLSLRIAWDGQVIRHVGISSTRPQAARLLVGQTSAGALALSRLLFSVCAQAQCAAAGAAIAVAGGAPQIDGTPGAHAVACEALQEHLWRLLIDWPEQLALPAARDALVRWHGAVRTASSTAQPLDRIGAEIGTEWLGMPTREWLAVAAQGGLADWWRRAASPAARLLARLAELDEGAGPGPAVGLLPERDAAQTLEAFGQQLGSEFAAQPSDCGVPLETGALAHAAGLPWLHDLLRQHPGRLLARVLARLHEALQITLGEDRQRIDACACGDGAGLAMVRTARGMLLHRARLEGDRVADYLLVAPTEWNFHPRGALVAGLQNVRVDSSAALDRLVGAQVLSLDPCVEYVTERVDA